MDPFGIGWVIITSIASAFFALMVFRRFPGRLGAAMILSLLGSVPAYKVWTGFNSPNSEMGLITSIAASMTLLSLWGIFAGRRVRV